MDCPITIERRATAERLAAVDRLAFHPGGSTPAESAAWSAKAYGRLLANPAVLGWLAIIPSEGDVALLCGQVVADEAEIYRIGVVPRLRLNGIARQLMGRFMERMTQLGVRQVTLDVRANNFPALALYRSMEFAPQARRKGYYAEAHEDALVMQCQLTQAARA